MNMDDTIRKAIFHLTTAGEVTWNDFLPGAGDQYTLWYYAERGQYILRDIMTDAHYFIEARSPIEAYKKYKKRMDEAMKAGSYQEEEDIRPDPLLKLYEDKMPMDIAAVGDRLAIIEGQEGDNDEEY